MKIHTQIQSQSQTQAQTQTKAQSKRKSFQDFMKAISLRKIDDLMDMLIEGIDLPENNSVSSDNMLDNNVLKAFYEFFTHHFMVNPNMDSKSMNEYESVLDNLESSIERLDSAKEFLDMSRDEVKTLDSTIMYSLSSDDVDAEIQRVLKPILTDIIPITKVIRFFKLNLNKILLVPKKEDGLQNNSNKSALESMAEKVKVKVKEKEEGLQFKPDLITFYKFILALFIKDKAFIEIIKQGMPELILYKQDENIRKTLMTIMTIFHVFSLFNLKDSFSQREVDLFKNILHVGIDFREKIIDHPLEIAIKNLDTKACHYLLENGAHRCINDGFYIEADKATGKKAADEKEGVEELNTLCLYKKISALEVFFRMLKTFDESTDENARLILDALVWKGLKAGSFSEEYIASITGSDLCKLNNVFKNLENQYSFVLNTSLELGMLTKQLEAHEKLKLSVEVASDYLSINELYHTFMKKMFPGAYNSQFLNDSKQNIDEFLLNLKEVEHSLRVKINLIKQNPLEIQKVVQKQIDINKNEKRSILFAGISASEVEHELSPKLKVNIIMPNEILDLICEYEPLTYPGEAQYSLGIVMSNYAIERLNVEKTLVLKLKETMENNKDKDKDKDKDNDKTKGKVKGQDKNCSDNAKHGSQMLMLYQHRCVFNFKDFVKSEIINEQARELAFRNYRGKRNKSIKFGVFLNG